jgi:hypothetical protein
MKLYVGEYWCPFPRSEYGGVWVVTAYNDQQVIDLLTKNCGSWDEEYKHLINGSVAKARVFYLDRVHDHSVEIVKTFFT